MHNFGTTHCAWDPNGSIQDSAVVATITPEGRVSMSRPPLSTGSFSFSVLPAGRPSITLPSLVYTGGRRTPGGKVERLTATTQATFTSSGDPYGRGLHQVGRNGISARVPTSPFDLPRSSAVA